MRVDHGVSRQNKGYSLVEALVVVALIGIFSVIAIPNFIQMYRSSKLKSSLRNFTADYRWIRQKAVTETTVLIISFPPAGTSSDSYRFYRGRLQPNGTVTANAVLRDGRGVPMVRTLEQTVYFSSTNFTDTVNTTALRAADTNYRDIVFLTNGSLRAAAGTPQVQMSTSVPIPFPTYIVDFSIAGGVKARKP